MSESSYSREYIPSAQVKKGEHRALVRLLNWAKRDTGQSRLIADVLLSWWNGDSCGHLKITDLWGLDASIEKDVILVLRMAVRTRRYPDSLGYQDEFKRLIKNWRPELK